MPDRRKHRGPHPEDEQLFARDQLPLLRGATHDLSWLLGRNYAAKSATKLVGDRYGLAARQRLAVARCACSEAARIERRAKSVPWSSLTGQELWLDGFNVLTSVEAALSGGVILAGRDGCYRDMASMHGSYRKVEETSSAIQGIGESLHAWQVGPCRWFLDRPVSNSGRLRSLLRKEAKMAGWMWEVDLVADPDAILSRARSLVSSSDSQILDRVPRWFNLARNVIHDRLPTAWIVDLEKNP